MVMLLKAKETADCSQRLLKLLLASLVVFVFKPLQLNWNFWQRYVWRKKKQLKMNSNGYLCSCMLSFLPHVSYWTAKHCGAERGNSTFYSPRRNRVSSGGVTLVLSFEHWRHFWCKEVSVPGLKGWIPSWPAQFRITSFRYITMTMLMAIIIRSSSRSRSSAKSCGSSNKGRFCPCLFLVSYFCPSLMTSSCHYCVILDML